MADGEGASDQAVTTKYTFLKAGSDTEPIDAEEGDLAEGQSAEDVWLRNVADGQPCRARAEYPNGDVYVGDFDEEGQKHGQGTYTYAVPAVREDPEDPDSEVVTEASSYSYTGGWADNQRSGVGKMTYPNGDSYHGQWLNGLRHGQGAYVKANGDMYSGAWSEGSKFGQGVYVYAADGSQLVGKWVQNKFKQGVWKMKDGTVYETEGTGRFVRNLPEGPGAFTFPGTGNVQRGEFITKKGVAQPVWKPLENVSA